jgi:hypothetical protein
MTMTVWQALSAIIIIIAGTTTTLLGAFKRKPAMQDLGVFICIIGCAMAAVYAMI